MVKYLKVFYLKERKQLKTSWSIGRRFSPTQKNSIHIMKACHSIKVEEIKEETLCYQIIIMTTMKTNDCIYISYIYSKLYSIIAIINIKRFA